MDNLLGLLFTLLTGIFFLVGGFISLKVKDKDKLNRFSVALAFVIMLGLIFGDLLPEGLELLEEYSLAKKIGLVVIFGSIGFMMLKLLDILVPHHHHEHHEINDDTVEHIEHNNHVGTLTIISLILHNIIEGCAIFGLAINSLKVGFLTAISVALHNIPLGTHIFSAIDYKKNSKLIFLLTISSLLGGLIFIVFGSINDFVLACITLITLGMIIYIDLFELMPSVKCDYKSKETILGLFLGIIIIILSLFV